MAKKAKTTKKTPDAKQSQAATDEQKVAESAKAEEPVAEEEQKQESVAASGADEQSTQEAAPSGPSPEQQAQIDAVLKTTEAEARKAVEAILGGSSMAKVGTPSGDIEDRQDKVQADHIPGTRRRKKTDVPETVYDDRTGRVKKVLDYNRFRYCMCTEDDFHNYTGDGWKFCKFDGGSLSGLLNDGWQGTGDAVFFRDIRGYCRRADCFLMYIEIQRYKEIEAEDREARERAQKAPVGHFADVAYGKGIRAMAQVNGEDLL